MSNVIQKWGYVGAFGISMNQARVITTPPNPKKKFRGAYINVRIKTNKLYGDSYLSLMVKSMVWIR